jgi:hypothetical protein
MEITFFAPGGVRLEAPTMRVSINVLGASAEVFASVCQMLDLVRSAVGEQFPTVSGIAELSIGLKIAHPSCGLPRLRGSGSYSERAGTSMPRPLSRSVAYASGFRPIAPSRNVTLVVVYAIADSGSESDLGRRHALEDFLNEQTDWMGLGHCDGGSSGSHSMEAFCVVVDGKIAKQTLALALAASPFSDFKVRVQPRHGPVSRR